jgi:hypothetical protein
MPTEAGTHATLRKQTDAGVDPRLRGDDVREER